MHQKALYIVVLLLLLAALSCGDPESMANHGNDADSALVPDSEMFGAKIYLSEEGVVTTSIQFDHLVEYNSIDSSMAYIVSINGFDSTGSSTGQLIGDSAVIREGAGVMLVYGHVLLISENGYRLETEFLCWDSKNDELRTEEFIRITRGHEWATGYGFVADQSISRFKIMNNAKGTLVGGDDL